MSLYFHCFDCDRIREVNQETNTCPHCKSKNGRMMTDEEFNRQYSKDIIKLIDPNTGKPMK